MKVEKNLYESPKLETREIFVEQAVLQSSIPDMEDGGDLFGGDLFA